MQFQQSLLSRSFFVSTALASACLVTNGNAEASGRSYARKDPVTTSQFGVSYSDPYRWMENSDDRDLAPWWREQTSFTKAEANAERHAIIKAEFLKILAPQTNFSRGKKHLDLTEREFTWRNRFAPLAGDNLDAPRSPSGRYEIKLSAETGSDLKIVRIHDKTTDQYLADSFLVKFAVFFWDKSEESFVYLSDRDGRLGGTRSIIRRHILGTRQQDDKVLVEAPTYDTVLNPVLAGDVAYLVEDSPTVQRIYKFDMETGERTLIVSRTGDGPLDLLDSYKGKLLFVDHHDTRAPLGAIVSFDPATGETKTIIAQRDIALESAAVVGDSIYVSYVRDASSELYEYSLVSELQAGETVPLPGTGSVRFGSVKDGKLTLQYSHYDVPPATYTVSQGERQLSLVGEAPTAHLELETQRIFYQLPTGQTAPIWIVKLKSTRMNPSTMVYMTGYGGFSANLLPWYPFGVVPFLKRGGVFAVATLPGGLEYGQAWHRLGQLENKQNVYNAFAEAAKHLVSQGLTSHDKIAIGGASNGGLLAAATAQLYPSLFAAAVPEVGVLDMVRFARFTGGKWWEDEYGNASIKDQFLNLFRLSPYHMLKRGDALPHILVITADNDDRVVPAHSFKYAARLIEYNRGSDKAALLHVRRASSHGWRSGQPADIAEDQAIKWDFIISKLTAEQ